MTLPFITFFQKCSRNIRLKLWGLQIFCMFWVDVASVGRFPIIPTYLPKSFKYGSVFLYGVSLIRIRIGLWSNSIREPYLNDRDNCLNQNPLAFVMLCPLGAGASVKAAKRPLLRVFLIMVSQAYLNKIRVIIIPFFGQLHAIFNLCVNKAKTIVFEIWMDSQLKYSALPINSQRAGKTAFNTYLNSIFVKKINLVSRCFF